MAESGAAVGRAKQPEVEQNTTAQNTQAVLDILRQKIALTLLELTNYVSVPHQEVGHIVFQLEQQHLVKVSDRDSDDPIVTIRDQALRA